MSATSALNTGRSSFERCSIGGTNDSAVLKTQISTEHLELAQLFLHFFADAYNFSLQDEEKTIYSLHFATMSLSLLEMLGSPLKNELKLLLAVFCRAANKQFRLFGNF